MPCTSGIEWHIIEEKGEKTSNCVLTYNSSFDNCFVYHKHYIGFSIITKVFIDYIILMIAMITCKVNGRIRRSIVLIDEFVSCFPNIPIPQHMGHYRMYFVNLCHVK